MNEQKEILDQARKSLYGKLVYLGDDGKYASIMESESGARYRLKVSRVSATKEKARFMCSQRLLFQQD